MKKRTMGQAPQGQDDQQQTERAAKRRKMELIREQLAAGTYKVDTDKLADALLRDMQQPSQDKDQAA